jgi:hypothetical protein
MSALPLEADIFLHAVGVGFVPFPDTTANPRRVRFASESGALVSTSATAIARRKS